MLNKLRRIILLLSVLCISFSWSKAQEVVDTLNGRLLEEVQVTAAPQQVTSRSISPLQVMKANTIQSIGALQVSDAIKFFSGIQVRDYGGIGGLKTVSIRSLGANYTGVVYDGLPVTDYQTGQVDLGRFSTENVETISLVTGENDDLLQTAGMHSMAGAIDIKTNMLQSGTGKSSEVKAMLKSGSFGLINPAVIFGKVLNKTFSLNVTGEWLKSEGDYPYTQYYGYSKDSSSVEKRTNSDVNTWKSEVNLSGQFSNNGKMHIKAYYYDSEKGLPGPAILYNSYSGERTRDQSTFIQGNYTQSLNERIKFRTGAKFNYSYIDYQNLFAGGNLNAEYYQREYTGNATFQYTCSPVLAFSWANDGAYSNFSNSFKNCPLPYRTSWLSAISGKYATDRIILNFSLLNSYFHDATQKTEEQTDYNHLSPYAGFSFKLLKEIPLRLRVSYKNTFRMPTFGDLYYSNITKPGLKPEKADQYNLGLTWVSALNNLLPYVSLSTDVYLNRISDKIVALPTSSMFNWSVQNYGKVEIKGLDIDLELHAVTGKLNWSMNTTYTLQNVLDKTDLSSPMYNQQLPYAPQQVFSGYLNMEAPWFNLNYNLLYSGKRYYERVNRPENALNPYTDQSIILSRRFNLKKSALTLSAECLNLLDEQYVVVRSYPMPGRSFRFSVKYEY